MASDKKPSIYSDRSTIGSSDELDEYGVWVKSEPQNFSSSSASSAGGEADDVVSLPDFDSGLDLPDLDIPDDNLSVSDEADSFSSFESDLGTLDDTSLEDASFDDFSIPEDDAVMNANIDLEDSIGLDDVDGTSVPDNSAADSISLDDSIDLEDSIGLEDNLDDNLELDDGLLDDSIEFDDSLEADIDNDESIELDFPSVESMESGESMESMESMDDDGFDSSDETPFEDAGFTEIDMDDFMDESPAELPSVGVTQTKAAQTPAAHTQSDLSTQLLMKIADELSSIRTELTSLKKEFAGLKAEASAEEKTDSQHGGFFNEEEDEKIALTGDELDNILTTADFTEEAGEDATEELESDFSFPEVEDDTSSVPFQVSDESVTDLESLADETGIPDILSEQDDIIGINDEIGEIDEIGESDEIGEIGEIEKSDEIGDQIDISLESDDLILDQVENFTPAFDKTDRKDAEYIEEIGETEDLGLTDESFDLHPEDAGTLDNIEVADIDIPAIEIEDIDSAFVAPADSEELQELMENGAVPMTPAPEDTTYLDEELSGDSGLDDIDISMELPPEDSVPEPEIEEYDFQKDAFEIPSDEAFEIEIEEDVPDIQPDIQEEDFSLPSGEDFFDEQPLDISLTETEETEEEPIGISQEEFDKLNSSADADTEIQETEKLPVVNTAADEGDSLDQVIPEGFVVSDDDEAPAPFDDDLEMEEVESLEDIGFNEAEELVSDETLDASDDSTGIKSAEYPEPGTAIPSGIKSELKIVLSYMDQLLESLPEAKIEEFAKSEYFDTYKKLFKELGLA